MIPLYKGKGCKLEPKQYRSLSKVLERCVSLQVLRHMDNNSYLNSNHHAYTTSHSTTTTLVQMYDTWLEALEEGQVCAWLIWVQHLTWWTLIYSLRSWSYIDLIRYYTVSLKLAYIHITGGVYRWSHVKSISPWSRCPQWSILGPLYYSIFTNELKRWDKYLCLTLHYTPC